MNPSSNEAFSAPPSPEQATAPVTPPVAGQKAPEKAPAGAEIAATMMPLPPLASPSPAAPAATPVVTAQDDASTSPTAAAMPLSDDDLIEKEWVNKAKAIVERTRDDPYRQSEELTAVKVDYMQKHYNKTIKLAK